MNSPFERIPKQVSAADVLATAAELEKTKHGQSESAPPPAADIIAKIEAVAAKNALEKATPEVTPQKLEAPPPVEAPQVQDKAESHEQTPLEAAYTATTRALDEARLTHPEKAADFAALESDIEAARKRMHASPEAALEEFGSIREDIDYQRKLARINSTPMGELNPLPQSEGSIGGLHEETIEQPVTPPSIDKEAEAARWKAILKDSLEQFNAVLPPPRSTSPQAEAQPDEHVNKFSPVKAVSEAFSQPATPDFLPVSLRSPTPKVETLKAQVPKRGFNLFGMFGTFGTRKKEKEAVVRAPEPRPAPLPLEVNADENLEHATDAAPIEAPHWSDDAAWEKLGFVRDEQPLYKRELPPIAAVIPQPVEKTSPPEPTISPPIEKKIKVKAKIKVKRIEPPPLSENIPDTMGEQIRVQPENLAKVSDSLISPAESRAREAKVLEQKPKSKGLKISEIERGPAAVKKRELKDIQPLDLKVGGPVSSAKKPEAISTPEVKTPEPVVEVPPGPREKSKEIEPLPESHWIEAFNEYEATRHAPRNEAQAKLQALRAEVKDLEYKAGHPIPGAMKENHGPRILELEAEIRKVEKIIKPPPPSAKVEQKSAIKKEGKTEEKKEPEIKKEEPKTTPLASKPTRRGRYRIEREVSKAEKAKVIGVMGGIALAALGASEGWKALPSKEAKSQQYNYELLHNPGHLRNPEGKPFKFESNADGMRALEAYIDGLVKKSPNLTIRQFTEQYPSVTPHKGKEADTWSKAFVATLQVPLKAKIGEIKKPAATIAEAARMAEQQVRGTP